jgi:hypothetical protein
MKGSTGSVVMLSTSIPLTSAQAPAAHTLQGLDFLTIYGNNPEILTRIVMVVDCKTRPHLRNAKKLMTIRTFTHFGMKYALLF